MWNWLFSLFNLLFSHLPAPLQRLWTFLVQFKTKTLNIFNTIFHLIESVETEVAAIRTFEIDIRWKTRVISAPRAVQQTQDFFNAFPTIFDNIKALIQQVRDKINVPETEFTPDEISDIRRLPKKLIPIAEKVAAWAGIIVDSLAAIESGLDELQAIVDAVHTIRVTIETMDGIFLPQGSTKKTVDEHYRKRQRQ
jgi:hypothetical protein